MYGGKIPQGSGTKGVANRVDQIRARGVLIHWKIHPEAPVIKCLYSQGSASGVEREPARVASHHARGLWTHLHSFR